MSHSEESTIRTDSELKAATKLIMRTLVGTTIEVGLTFFTIPLLGATLHFDTSS